MSRTLIKDPLDTEIEDLPSDFRYVAGAAILKQHDTQRKEPLLLVVKRAAIEVTFPGYWEIPGGSVEQGETIRQGVDRETFEETGLVVQRILGRLSQESFRGHITGEALLQCSYIVEVAQPANVKLDPNEHDDWRWATEAEVQELQRLPEQVRLMQEAFEFARSRDSVG